MPEILVATEEGKFAFYRGGRVVILEKCTTWQCETYGTSLKIATWNGNGSLKLDVSAFEDSFKEREIIFYSEMHQAPRGTLLKVSSYKWEKTCRREVRSECRGRGSGGVEVLIKEELQPIIHINRRDEQARYM